MNCPKCGREKVESNVCIYCGHQFVSTLAHPQAGPVKSGGGKKAGAWLFLLIALFLIIWIYQFDGHLAPCTALKASFLKYTSNYAIEQSNAPTTGMLMLVAPAMIESQIKTLNQFQCAERYFKLKKAGYEGFRRIFSEG